MPQATRFLKVVGIEPYDSLDRDIDEKLKRYESISEEMDVFLCQNFLLLPQSS
jgi:thermostable 8-oxoguanine DNA glycosylase